MTDEQKAKIQKRILVISAVLLVLLIGTLVLVGVAGLAETVIFPVVVALFLAIYWIVSDVMSVVWLHSFEGKTDEQKKNYYIYAGLELIGLGGLVYFLVDMKGTTGAIIFVCCLFLKKRFKDEFDGVTQDAEDDGADGDETDAGEGDAADAKTLADDGAAKSRED